MLRTWLYLCRCASRGLFKNGLIWCKIIAIIFQAIKGKMNKVMPLQETILIVEDMPTHVEVLLDFLTQANFKVIVANTGQDALQSVREMLPDLILLDVMLPDISGFEVCNLLKKNSNTERIPIIFLTALANTQEKIKGFSLGAVDYVTKPIQYEELLIRINSHLKTYYQQRAFQEQNEKLTELNSQLEQLEHHLVERSAQLEQANYELSQLSGVDYLTQIANRRHFEETLIYQWQRLTQAQLPLSLILADIDHFKHYNDDYGHLAGDDCLRQIAQAISRALKRPTDLAARYGGEEFVVILPDTDMKVAMQVAMNIQQLVRELKIIGAPSLKTKEPYVSLSLGIACIIPQVQYSPKQLIQLADEALYEAKKYGRNRFVIRNYAMA
jgi:diguanylate cyclase (GGDEF)-like protein